MFCCEGYVFTHVMLSLTIPCVSFYLVWNSNCQTIIFEVGSLLIKEGTMCSAAMCTFPIHSVKHPITLWNQLLKDPELKYELLVLFSHPFWVPTLIEVPFSFDIIWGSHSCWSTSRMTKLAVVQSFLAHLCPDFQACSLYSLKSQLMNSSLNRS